MKKDSFEKREAVQMRVVSNTSVKKSTSVSSMTGCGKNKEEGNRNRGGEKKKLLKYFLSYPFWRKVEGKVGGNLAGRATWGF